VGYYDIYRRRVENKTNSRRLYIVDGASGVNGAGAPRGARNDPYLYNTVKAIADQLKTVDRYHGLAGNTDFKNRVIDIMHNTLPADRNQDGKQMTPDKFASYCLKKAAAEHFKQGVTSVRMSYPTTTEEKRKYLLAENAAIYNLLDTKYAQYRNRLNYPKFLEKVKAEIKDNIRAYDNAENFTMSGNISPQDFAKSVVNAYASSSKLLSFDEEADAALKGLGSKRLDDELAGLK
jgi:hypothetical protein